MKAHSNEFKEEIKLLGKQQNVRITYTIDNEQKVLESEDINSATPNYEASLLKSVMKILDIDSNIDIPLGTEIKFEYGLLVNEAYEYLDYGNYIVYSSEKQEDTLSYKIKCYDKMLYAMKDYEHIEIDYPCTIKQYLTALCTKIGLTFKDSDFANANRQITSELFMTINEDGTYSSMGYTYRDVLDQIAETAGGCICMTLDDYIEVRYIKKLEEGQTKTGNPIQITDNVEEKINIKKVFGNNEYETAGVTPTPSSPNEIKTVGNNFNLLDVDKTTYNLTTNLQKEGENLKGTNVNLIRIGTFDNSVPQLEEQLKSGDYTISYEVEANANVTIQNLFLCVIYEDDTQENIGSGKSYSLEKDVKKKFFWTINVKRNVKKIGIVSYLSNSCDIIVSKVKIEKGDSVSGYSKYKQGSVEVKAVNKNILPADEKTAEWDGAKISIAKNDLTITPNESGGSAVVFNGNNLDINIKKDETITFSWKYKEGNLNINDGGAFGVVIKLKYADGTEGEIKPADITKANQQSSSSATIILEKDVKAVYVYAYPWNISGATGSSTYTLQMEKNSSATESIEHQEQDVTIPIQQELLKGDYVDFEKQKEIHNWGKIENYNGESVTTEYISTTGELSTGATVYYKLETPIQLNFTTEQKNVESLYFYDKITNIYSNNELALIEVSYLTFIEQINEEYINDTNVNFGEKYRTNQFNCTCKSRRKR